MEETRFAANIKVMYATFQNTTANLVKICWKLKSYTQYYAQNVKINENSIAAQAQ